MKRISGIVFLVFVVLSRVSTQDEPLFITRTVHLEVNVSSATVRVGFRTYNYLGKTLSVSFSGDSTSINVKAEGYKPQILLVGKDDDGKTITVTLLPELLKKNDLFQPKLQPQKIQPLQTPEPAPAPQATTTVRKITPVVPYKAVVDKLTSCLWVHRYDSPGTPDRTIPQSHTETSRQYDPYSKSYYSTSRTVQDRPMVIKGTPAVHLRYSYRFTPDYKVVFTLYNNGQKKNELTGTWRIRDETHIVVTLTSELVFVITSDFSSIKTAKLEYKPEKL